MDGSGHIKQWFQRVIQPTSHLIRHQISEAEKKGKKPKVGKARQSSVDRYHSG